MRKDVILMYLSQDKTSGELLWIRWWTSGFLKVSCNSLPIEALLAL